MRLPPPARGSASLEHVLFRRRSVRDYGRAPITTAQLSHLLWAGQGVTDGGRTAPSAGALYPLELYAVTAEGLYHYVPRGHRLATIARDDLRQPLAQACLGQDAVAQAPLSIVIAAAPARLAATYGARSERYATLEAGHAGQNVLLAAVALGLGAVVIGAFVDREVGAVLGLAPELEAREVIPVGQP